MRSPNFKAQRICAKRIFARFARNILGVALVANAFAIEPSYAGGGLLALPEWSLHRMVARVRAAEPQLPGHSNLSAPKLPITPARSDLSQPSVQMAAYTPKIRVRIGEALESFGVRGFDLKFTASSEQNARGKVPSTLINRGPASALTDRTSAWGIQCKKGKVQITNVQQISQKFEFSSPLHLESPSGFFTFQDRPYREQLKIYAEGNRCEVVNQVDLEKYLDGLVNSEFNAQWSEEAVAAQVIAARTYGLFQAKEFGSKRHFDVDSTTKDQVYDGTYKEDYHASRVVEKTRGWILSSADAKKPLKAYYHSTCGGSTELPERVWGEKTPGFKRRVACPYCASSPRFNWQMILGPSEIAQALRDAVVKKQIQTPHSWSAAQQKEVALALQSGQVSALKVFRRDTSGRAHVVGVQISGRLWLEMSGAQFRMLVSPLKVKSTLFDLQPQLALGSGTPIGWSLTGHGNGHGVGLCQWGAKVMAEMGKSHRDILNYYYPDAKLARLW